MTLADAIYKSCELVYGDCTDGSFESCLAARGYYRLRKAEKDNEIIDGVQGPDEDEQ